MFNASNVTRLLLFNLAAFCLIGIGLTGFSQVHWFAYALSAVLLVAAATGFSPVNSYREET